MGFLIALGASIILAVLARSGEAAFLGGYAAINIVGFVFSILIIIAAFREGVMEGVLSLICGIYTLYFGLVKIESPLFRALWGGLFLGYIVFFVLNFGAITEFQEGTTTYSY